MNAETLRPNEDMTSPETVYLHEIYDIAAKVAQHLQAEEFQPDSTIKILKGDILSLRDGRIISNSVTKNCWTVSRNETANKMFSTGLVLYIDDGAGKLLDYIDFGNGQGLIHAEGYPQAPMFEPSEPELGYIWDNAVAQKLIDLLLRTALTAQQSESEEVR